MIEQSSIESLKQTIDIVDVIGNYVELKKAGANYKANCPFHGEKTPSFVVSPTKQIYHCFGCGVGGDAITFVMEYEKLNYPEAIEKLASMYNVSLRYTKGKGDFDDLRRILEVMQKWYRSNLKHHTQARTYLQERKVSLETIERFGIGYAPSAQEITRFIQQTAVPTPKAIDAGILAQAQHRTYPRLIERITFPIHSPSGGLVGFGGRTLGSHPAKYINSPQTKLFNKSRLLYGYHLAKTSIYRRKEIIVCEGYLDVMMLHQGGFTTAVATLGTALTSEHLPLLRKGEPRVILAYDGDKAGKEAALKASKLLVKSNFEGGVALFPKGLDPADMVAQNRTKELSDLFANARAFIPFILEMTIAPFNLNDAHEKEKAFNLTKEFLAQLSPITQESYLPLAASLLQVPQALFGAVSQQAISQTIQTKHEDPVLLSLLKSAIENQEALAYIQKHCNREFFVPYQEVFDAIIQKDQTHPHVRRLMLDDQIKTLPLSSLKESVGRLILKRYEQMLSDVASNTSLPFSQKSYLIRKLKSDIIPRLKKGQVFPFVPLSTLLEQNL